jgi:hypothetical protein
LANLFQIPEIPWLTKWPGVERRPVAGRGNVFGAVKPEELSSVSDMGLGQVAESLKGKPDTEIINGRSVRAWKADIAAEAARRELVKQTQQTQGKATGEAISKTFQKAMEPYARAMQGKLFGEQSMESTAPVNILRGSGNTLAQWAMSGFNPAVMSTVNNPNLRGSALPAVKEAWSWLTEPEGVRAQRQIAEEGGTAPTFLPGLPPMSDATASTIGAESGFNPTARNPRSSAGGLSQAIDSTWLEFIDEVHPELKEGRTKEQLIAMKTDPKQANLHVELTDWYQNQGIAMLTSLGMPVTKANLYLNHFLGPGGMSAVLTAAPGTSVKDALTNALGADKANQMVKANPTVLGGEVTVDSLQEWARLKTGQAATPPKVGSPNYTQADEWLTQAAPKPLLSPEELAKFQKKMKKRGMLSGLLATSDEAGVGDILGAAGGGWLQGSQGGDTLALRMQEQFMQQQQAYAQARAGVAENRAINQATIDQANAELDYKTKAMQQADLSGGLEIIKLSDTGMWVQPRTAPGMPAEMPVFIPTADAAKQFETMKKVGDALGQGNPAHRDMQYDALIQQVGQSPTGLIQVQSVIMNDLINDGLGPAVFGQAFTDAIAAAEQSIPPTFQGKERIEMVMRLVPSILLNEHLQQQNNGWLIQAAQLGNPGAAKLIQYGTMSQTTPQGGGAMAGQPR